MTPDTLAAQAPEIVYPDSDGLPISDNTKQYRWIATFYLNLEGAFADRPDVFVAADNLWYPVEGRPDIRRAPDVYVVFGRPKGDRGSYKQWEEGGIAPQVVFEVWSPNNTEADREDKYDFYTEYGVEEYYLYDPDTNEFSAWVRSGTALLRQPTAGGFTSPRLAVRFEPGEPELRAWRPDGTPFLTTREADAQRQAAVAEAAAEKVRADALAVEAAAQARLLDAERAKAAAAADALERLHQFLRERGIEPPGP